MEHDHIVKSFDEDLGRIDAIIAEMGGLAERQLAQAIEAMVKRDTELAEQVIQSDKRIDDLEMQLDDHAVRLLALRQPMAEDLRLVISALKMASNLERIGDYAKNVAKRTLILSTMEPVGNATQTLARMAAQVQGMIKNVLDAYGARDIHKAEGVRQSDEEVDLMHTSLFRELLTYMMEDPRNITACSHLLFMAKNVERIGDHTTSIAEYVHFLVKGEMPSDERPKKDLSSQTVVEEAK